MLGLNAGSFYVTTAETAGDAENAVQAEWKVDEGGRRILDSRRCSEYLQAAEE
jgi:hypothetical protein